jgi:LCP family protein required for cell wall assembly
MTNDPDERPYKLYRSAPRGLIARLRGESDPDLANRIDRLQEERAKRRPRDRTQSRQGRAPDGREVGPREAAAAYGRAAGMAPDAEGWSGYEPGSGHAARGGPGDRPPRRGIGRVLPRWLPRRTPGVPRPPIFRILRVVKWLVLAAIAWVVLSIVIFFIAASGDSGNLPGGKATKAALTGAGPMLFSPNTILVVGLDSRPKTGYSSHEGGANYNEADAQTDTLMLWRIGGGVSRRLSIPRDTLVTIPGCGTQKINAAWSCGGPKETIHVIESLTGVKINHMIVVDLGNFVKFIDDIGGVTVKTGRICSNISGGKTNGGYTLNLKPGVHHLNGVEAVTLARTRDNSCNNAYTDIQREEAQQRIVNGIKSQLFSLHAFFHLPWAAGDAPGAIQTDLGPLGLSQLFISAEIGGSAPTRVLKETPSTYDGADVLLPNKQNVQREAYKLMTGQ